MLSNLDGETWCTFVLRVRLEAGQLKIADRFKEEAHQPNQRTNKILSSEVMRPSSLCSQ